MASKNWTRAAKNNQMTKNVTDSDANFQSRAKTNSAFRPPDVCLVLPSFLFVAGCIARGHGLGHQQLSHGA